MKLKVRTLFLSDCHLGSSGAQAEQLARALKHVECESIYLVGDIIDMWRLRQRWYWPDAHNSVIRRLLKMSHRGTLITYIPGNHDEFARPFCGLTFGGIRISMDAVHETADGRRLLVTHGDQFDLVVRNSRMLALAGSMGYELLLKINRAYNAIRRLLSLPYDSLSQAIKARVKQACTFISNFEGALVAEARRGGFDGVVCGHIHKVEQRVIDGIDYYNCGDWVESCTMLVEHEDGRFEVVDGLAFLAKIDALKAMQLETDAGTLGGSQGADDDFELDAGETDPWFTGPVAAERRLFTMLNSN